MGPGIIVVTLQLLILLFGLAIFVGMMASGAAVTARMVVLIGVAWLA